MKGEMLQGIIGDYPTFLKDVTERVWKAGIDPTDLVQLDHMCYRTSSLEAYLEKQEGLKKLAELLGETEVNGRPISTFRLNQPAVFEKWIIDAIELPAPKPSSTYPDGLEHIEFVIRLSLEEFLRKYASLPFETKSADRGINPEISLQLGEYTAKFHLLNLPTVVWLERRVGITEVKDS